MKTVLGFGVLALLLLIGVQEGVAHTKEESSYPADGMVLTQAPASIDLSFDKPMRVTLFQVLNADGEIVPVGRKDDMQPVRDFTATPPSLSSGTYTVKWRGLSEDGHAMSGRITFEIAE